MDTKYKCACCGNLTLEESGKHEICPVCFWEDDLVQNEDPTFAGGSNAVSLTEAKVNFAEFGACEKRYIDKVRKVSPDEINIADLYDEYKSDDEEE